MSPHYTQLRDGNTVTIPEEYRPKEYVPGGLRIFGRITTDSERKGKEE